ncbi:MAG: beta-ketoacyl-[acyl-carrier-protein] synthase family protein [Pirellulales bacterium]
MKRRVVITGMGCVTPMGVTPEAIWDGIKRGDSGVDVTTVFDASQFPTKFSAEVRNWDVSEAGLDPAFWNRRGRHTRFAAAAAKKAVDASGILDNVLDPTRFGVYLGSGEGQQDFDAFTKMILMSLNEDGEINAANFVEVGMALLNPTAELEQEPNMPAAHLAGLFDAQGPNANCLTACAASSQAIGEAVELIRRGDCDVMLSGGTHSMIHPFGVTGFNLLTALSTRNDEPKRASRPFDRDRDGFVLGEGAAMVVLEELEHAKARGAEIHGEIIGYGSTADAYRITDTHPEGRGATTCVNLALQDAGLNSDQIDYVNAHGTGTQVNDKVETRTIKQVFGERAYDIPVSSTKSMMGHLIAAAGATELIVCLLAIRDDILPPTINYENPDPACDLDYVPNQAREAPCKTVLTNSFGFCGQNIALIACAYSGDGG